MPNEEKKGITVKINADLHAEVRRYFFGFCKLLNIFLYLLIGKRTDAFSGIPGNKECTSQYDERGTRYHNGGQSDALRGKGGEVNTVFG